MSRFRRVRGTGGERKPGISGPARITRDDTDLTAGLRAGDVAVINRVDLDRSDAERLIAAQVAAVINVAASTSGRFPNLGPQTLVDAGVGLVDEVGPGILTRVRSGDRLRVHEGKVFRDGILIASGVDRDHARARADLTAASSDLTTQLDVLAANAADHLRREHAMLLEGVRVPRVRTSVRKRPVVIVSDAFDAAADVKGLRRFIMDREPVLIGAGRGADVIVATGYRPDIVIGTPSSLSADAVRRAREVVVTTSSGRLETPERLEKHGEEILRFVAAGEDTDLAILLADGNEASIIVHAGAAPTLVDFLAQGSGLVGPAFVVRLRAAAKIVDAKAVAHVTSRRNSVLPNLLLILAGVAVVGVALTTTPEGSDAYSWLGDQLGDFRTWIEGRLP